MSKSVTKARNGRTLTKENRTIPRFILTVKECWRSFVTDLDTLTRDRLQQRRQCALPISTRSTPAMMSAMPTATSIVTDSPKRIIDSTAVSATPKAPQSP